MRFRAIPQIHDAIMVRLFTYDNNGLTRILSPLAMEWANKRKIEYTIQNDRTLLFLLPTHMEEYMDWSKFEFMDTLQMAIFANSLDMIQWAGWTTAKKRMRKFSMAEWHWLRKTFPDQHEWMRPR